MKVRLRTKVSLSFISVMLICMLVLDVAVFTVLEPLFIYDSKIQMLRYSQVIEEVMLGEEPDADVIDGILRSFYESYLITTDVVKDGERIASSVAEQFRNNTKKIERYEKLIGEYENSGERDYFKERYDEDEIRKFFYVHKCADGSYIIMQRKTDGIDQQVKLVIILLLFSELIIMLIGVCIWMVLTAPFTKLLEKMSVITKNISELNFDDKIGYSGKDLELGKLADSIDYLSDELSKSISDMEQELDQKKVMLRNLAHEIKTPLTTIKGYTENIQTVLPDNARVNRYCKIMLDECDSLDFLANEMMHAASFETSERFRVRELLQARDIFEIVSHVKNGFLEREIQVNYEPAELYANRELLRIVLSNYLDNAVKYSKKNTVIHVEGKCMEDRYLISVTNEGEAIDPSEQDLIWKPFYRTDKSRNRNGSHGIGLSLVKQIAEMHDGQVGVHCKEGMTTFYFSIPMSGLMENIVGKKHIQGQSGVEK